MLLQTLIGAWPLDLLPDDAAGVDRFLTRIAAWQTKALREAKRHASWVADNPAYESACGHYLHALRDATAPDLTLDEIARLARAISTAGAVNSLSQCFLRMTAPGIPDLYQGSERWDYSLVDPDNRRPVNYDIREHMQTRVTIDAEWRTLLASWRDGRVKQALIAKMLAERRQRAELFVGGRYIPLQVRGPMARCALAFQRQNGPDIAICILTRLAWSHLKTDELRIAPALWQDSHVVLGSESRPPRWHEAFTGREYTAPKEGVMLSSVLTELPVALLIGGAIDAV
jgi:(1->4)-alpha-D-glucan 1-alpha-D-glucosylmutase